MCKSRPLVVAVSLTLFIPSMAASQKPDSLRRELTSVRELLLQRLTPVEASLFDKLDSIERRIDLDPWWRDPKVVFPVVVAFAGWGFALYQLQSSKRQRTWELLLESLAWFEGGTQKRSIGIAVVETKWEHHPEFRARWGSILVNQAIYLLTRGKDPDAKHERANLYRIMNLLTEKRLELQDFERSILAETLHAYSPSGSLGLQQLDPNRMAKWKQAFPDPASK